MARPRPDTASVPLKSGVTLVFAGERSIVPHRLTIAQQAAERGHILWIDARDTASTYALYELADETRLLSGIQIARAWTAYQHHTLVRQLVERVSPRTRLLVLPNVCSLYRDSDIDEPIADRLLKGSLETVAELVRVSSVPAILTAPPAERTVLAPFVDEMHIASEQEEPRGDWMQTTIPYWVQQAGSRYATELVECFPQQTRQTVLGPESRQRF